MIKGIKSRINSDSNLKELISGSAVSFVLKISGMFLGYVAVYLISKKNGADGVGYYSLINQLLMFLGIIASLGMNDSVLRYVGQFNNEKDAPQIRNIYRGIITMIIPFSILLALITYFGSDIIAVKIFGNKEYIHAIEITALAIPFFAINKVSVEYIRGLKRIKISEFIRSVTRPLIIISCLAIYWVDQIPNIFIIYIFALTVVINCLLSSITIWIHLAKIKKPKLRKVGHSAILKVSLPMMITAVSMSIISFVSLILLEYYWDTENVGIYSIAFRISQLIAIILVVVNTIAAPKFSELYWSDNHEKLQKILHQSAKMIFWGTIVLSGIVLFASEWLLTLFGKEFIGAELALIILIASQVINGMTGSVTLLLNMSGNQGTVRTISIICLIIQLVISFVLIPSHGVLGAAISTGISLALWNILCTLYVKVKLNLRTYYIPFIH